MFRTRAFHRFYDHVKKARKLSISKINNDWYHSFIDHPSRLGQLVKGKVFCSCFICNGWHKRKVSGPLISELRTPQYNEDYYEGSETL